MGGTYLCDEVAGQRCRRRERQHLLVASRGKLGQMSGLATIQARLRYWTLRRLSGLTNCKATAKSPAPPFGYRVDCMSFIISNLSPMTYGSPKRGQPMHLIFPGKHPIECRMGEDLLWVDRSPRSKLVTMVASVYDYLVFEWGAICVELSSIKRKRSTVSRTPAWVRYGRRRVHRACNRDGSAVLSFCTL